MGWGWAPDRILNRNYLLMITGKKEPGLTRLYFQAIGCGETGKLRMNPCGLTGVKGEVEKGVFVFLRKFPVHPVHENNRFDRECLY